jgi:hypothetical protein
VFPLLENRRHCGKTPGRAASCERPSLISGLTNRGDRASSPSNAPDSCELAIDQSVRHLQRPQDCSGLMLLAPELRTTRRPRATAAEPTTNCTFIWAADFMRSSNARHSHGLGGYALNQIGSGPGGSLRTPVQATTAVSDGASLADCTGPTGPTGPSIESYRESLLNWDAGPRAHAIMSAFRSASRNTLHDCWGGADVRNNRQSQDGYAYS